MIVICEPTCKQADHEKVNSGFVRAFSLAYPGQRIRFYAHASHIEAIKSILAYDGISVPHLEFEPIHYKSDSGILSLARYYFLFLHVLKDVVVCGVDKIFFLSFSPEALFALKILKQQIRFRNFKFAFVLHGAFEAIADDAQASSVVVFPRKTIPEPSLIERVRRTKLSEIPIKIIRRGNARLATWLTPSCASDFFAVKRMMDWRHSQDYRYVSLSMHATKNAARYLDPKRLPLFTVSMPVTFPAHFSEITNDFAKFAVIGGGEPLALHNVALALSKRPLSRPYEIRVIGRNHYGAEGLEHVVCVGKGKKLERAEMERQAKDVDALLILYDETRYRLTCSGAIFESLAMIKPIVQFDNECVNQFNTAQNPIGFRCFSFNEYVSKLEDIVNNYENYRKVLSEFRENVKKQREVFSIEKSVQPLRECFSWGPSDISVS